MVYLEEDNKALSAYWEQSDAIIIGGRTLTFGFPFGDSGKLDIQVKFIPKERLIISKTISSQLEKHNFTALILPNEIHTANDLITYVLKSDIGPSMGFGYELSQHLEDILNQALNNADS